MIKFHFKVLHKNNFDNYLMKIIQRAWTLSFAELKIIPNYILYWDILLKWIKKTFSLGTIIYHGINAINKYFYKY